MSHSYYNEVWLVTRNDMEKLLKLDRQVQDRKPTEIMELALHLSLSLYLKYRVLVRRLIICQNQMAQTQKRALIKRVLDCAIGRMLEYKRELVNLTFSDYHWPDDLMVQMKLTPRDIDMPSLEYHKMDLEKRRKYIDDLLASAAADEARLSESSGESTHETDVHEAESKEKVGRRRRGTRGRSGQQSGHGSILRVEESPETKARKAAEKAFAKSILMIQCHERARIGRCIALDELYKYQYWKKMAHGIITPSRITKEQEEAAAIKIQWAWRKYAKKLAHEKKLERLELLLGMRFHSCRSLDLQQKDKETFERRLGLIHTYGARTDRITKKEQAKLFQIRGPGLVEDITDEMREWFVVWYNELGYFDTFPAAHMGGSILIATGQTLTPQEFMAELIAKEKNKGKPPPKVVEKDKKDPMVNRGWKMPETQALPCLEEANEDFIANWKLRDESGNFEQEDYVDLIRQQLCYELQLEMREVVDELMRLELDKLNEALKKDHADDRPPFKPPTAAGAQKPKKQKKKKKEEQNPEELFAELTRAKIIKNYPNASLSDWFGDFSYENHEACLQLRDYQHRLGEIKQVVMEYCVLPLASKEVHRVAPLVRSVCICGLPMSGKSFLANAICTETGALLIDMSPASLAGKYLGNKKQKKLVEMVKKISRVYAPSIIFVDGGERPWMKQIPADERHLQPKRFAKEFPKLVKGIKRGDQILFLTLSSEPHTAARPFIKIHDKFIVIPMSDYNTLYMFYTQLLMKYPGVLGKMDVSSLAKMSIGIPLEFIRQAIETVLCLKRRITFKCEPLLPQEIIDEVLKYVPLPTLEKFKKFVTSIPLETKRQTLVAQLRIEAEQKRMQEARSKKKK